MGIYKRLPIVVCFPLRLCHLIKNNSLTPLVISLYFSVFKSFNLVFIKNNLRSPRPGFCITVFFHIIIAHRRSLDIETFLALFLSFGLSPKNHFYKFFVLPERHIWLANSFCCKRRSVLFFCLKSLILSLFCFDEALNKHLKMVSFDLYLK